MKKLLILFVILLTLLTTTTQAQTYSQNRLKYNDSTYIYLRTDKYNPADCKGLSFLVPGLGQMACGETERGILFLVGEISCVPVAAISGLGFIFYVQTGNDNATLSNLGIFMLSCSAFMAIRIWSSLDAEHIAKINNLYYRDLHRTSLLKLEVSPYVTQLTINNQQTTPVGMTLRVKF